MASRKGKKAEKQTKTPEVVQPEERPAEKEIVLGKGFFESDWTLMQEREDNLNYICGLVEEVFERSCIFVIHRATDRETYPYSVQWAKNLLLEKVECYFIESDVGDTISSLPDADDLCVMEDTEPDVPMIDSWARGVVPMKEDKPIELGQTNGVLEEFTAGEEVEERTPTEIIGPIDKPSSSHPLISVKPKKSHCHKPRNTINQPMQVISPPNEEKLNDKSASALSHTPISSTAFISIPPLMSGGVEDSSNLRLPHKHSQVLTDQHGRIIKTLPLDSRKFPSTSTRPIVTMQNEPLQTQHTARYNSKRTTGRLKPSVNTRIPLKNTVEGNISAVKSEDGKIIGGMNRIENNRIPREPTFPTFLDIIDPLPGVTVYEKGHTLTGHVSPRNKLWSPGSRLAPITPTSKKPLKKRESRISRKSDPLKLAIPSALDDYCKITTPTTNIT